MLVRRGVAGRVFTLLPSSFLALAARAVEVCAKFRHGAPHDTTDPIISTSVSGENNDAVPKQPPPDVADMVRMLGDTLEMARGLPGVLGREIVDVRAMLALIAAGSAQPERLTLRGAEGPPVHTLANPAALKRLLVILIDNALASGTRAVIRIDHGTCALVVHVDDDGPGIPRSQRALVFEPVLRLRAPRGAGMRLSIAKQIARAHGGEITVSCSPEGGARFTVRLPLLLDHELELAAAS